jgi:ABC-type antimicrobial peptide transport system ATPase subunit
MDNTDRVITAVLAGSAGGLLGAVVSGHSLVAALIAGVLAAAAALTGLMRYQHSSWIRGTTASLFPGAEAGPH